MPITREVVDATLGQDKYNGLTPKDLTEVLFNDGNQGFLNKFLSAGPKTIHYVALTTSLMSDDMAEFLKQLKKIGCLDTTVNRKRVVLVTCHLAQSEDGKLLPSIGYQEREG